MKNAREYKTRRNKTAYTNEKQEDRKEIIKERKKERKNQ